MPSNTFPSSVLELTALQEPDTPSFLDIRAFIGQLRRGPESDAFEHIQQAIDNLQQVLRTSAPTLEHLSIGSADIEDLTVGGQFGPGQMVVLNGPPDYLPIGWIGSAPSATPVSITSIVAGLVTAAGVHDLKPGDNVYIEATTDATQTGYYVVDTTPLTTTFTVVGGFSGNSTGGSLIKQFQGMWVKAFAAGGTNFADAPLQIDVDGSLSIDNALVTLTGPGGTIVFDPDVPWITIADAGDNIWAILGIQSDAPKTITAATNASPIVVTINAHGYANGDTIFNEGATGNTNVNGYRIVQNVTANTFTMTTIAGAQVNGNGTFGGTATAKRYFAGGLFQSMAIGTSWTSYKLRAFADGSLKIQGAEITLDGTGALITLDPNDGSITVTQTSPGTQQVVIASGQIQLNDTSDANISVQLGNSTVVVITDDSGGYSLSMTGGLTDGFTATLPTSTLNAAPVLRAIGYSGSNPSGHSVFFQHARGSASSPSATQASDVLGAILAGGYGSSFGAYTGGVLVVAGENHSSSNKGTKVTFNVTALGATTPATGMTLNEDKTLDVIGGYKVNGTAGIDLTASFGMSLTVGSFSDGVRGTPGVGQSNYTTVSTVSLNTTSRTFNKGILTA